MGRGLFNLIALASLVGMVAIATVWAASGARRITLLHRRGDPRPVSITAYDGYLSLTTSHHPIRVGDQFTAAPCRHIAGCVFDRSFGVGRQNSRVELAVPDLYALALSGVLPVIWLVAHRFDRLRATRLRSDPLCVGCGYDLRATTGRCPECGLVPLVRPGASR